MEDPRRITVLLVEDSDIVHQRIAALLDEEEHVQFLVNRAASLAAARGALETMRFEIILLDLGLPDSAGLETVRAVQAAAPHTPIIVLTALDDDQTALSALRMGAQDYLAKEYVRHPTVLSRAIQYAIERTRLQEELAAHQREIEELQGLLPICAICKKVRDDEGYWQQIETYLRTRIRAGLTHSICPACMETQYPDIARRVREENPEGRTE